jgi:hypothetical protein
VKTDLGPASTVDISSEGRARLRAAGAASADIAHVNLKDVHAVDRAVLKARAARLTAHHDATPAKPSAPSAKEPAASSEPTAPATASTRK